MIHFEHFQFKQIDNELWLNWQKCSLNWRTLPLQSPNWLKPVAEASEGSLDNLFLLVAKKNKEYLGFFPYRIEQRLLGEIIPLIYCLPWYDNLPSWITLTSDKEAGHQLLIEGFYKNLPKWHKLISGLVEHRNDTNNLEINFFLENKLFFTSISEEMAEIRNIETFDEFLQNQSKQWRKRYQKISKKLLASKQANLQHYTDLNHDELELLTQRVMSIYRESWKVNDKQSLDFNLTNPQSYRSFYALIKSYAECNGLHIMIISVNNEDAAFYVGVYQDGLYCSLQTAYKEKFANLSVGYLIQMENFRFTIENNFERNNLLANQSYKSNLTNQIEHYSRYTVYSRSILGLMARFLTYARQVITNFKTKT